MELSLLSWNVNGIRAAEKKGFLDWLAATDADIIAIQETKARPEQLSKGLLTPPGYHAHWCAAEKPGYSGVATYSRLAPVEVRTGLDDARFDHEGRTLITDYGDFVLFNIYFPNGGRGPEWVAHKIASPLSGSRGGIYGAGPLRCLRHRGVSMGGADSLGGGGVVSSASSVNPMFSG
jgi:exodeoxyribonuclease-3